MDELLRIIFFASILWILFVYDLRRGKLPDAVTLPGIVTAIIWNLMGGYVSWPSMLAGAFVVGGFFWIQFAVSHGRWIGGGDITMGMLVGVMLGLWSGLIATLIAYVLGAVFAPVLLAMRKKQREGRVPFGPFLSVGASVMLIYGEAIVGWYAQWFR